MAGGAGGDGLGWVETGAEVQIYLPKGGWWRAKVEEVDGDGGARSAYVKYPVWSSTWDEWVDDDARVREPLADDDTALETSREKNGDVAWRLPCRDRRVERAREP